MITKPPSSEGQTDIVPVDRPPDDYRTTTTVLASQGGRGKGGVGGGPQKRHSLSGLLEDKDDALVCALLPCWEHNIQQHTGQTKEEGQRGGRQRDKEVLLDTVRSEIYIYQQNIPRHSTACV